MPETTPPGELVVDVVVEQPAGDCNRYVYDAEGRALRLAEVLHPRDRFPADRGVVPNTLSSEGEPLSVILLITQPNFPGAVVPARPVALLDAGTDARTAIVAVPMAEPCFTTRRDVDDLAPHERHAIEALFGAAALTWHSASQALAQVRAARERAAWARAETRRGLHPGEAWKAEWLAGTGGPSDVHTSAEHGLRALPFRFQRYVADCLCPDERILLFVTRPPMQASSPGLSFWRRRHLPDGLLIVTDRQVLWMVDVLPPDATLVQWGYVAQSGAVERIYGARVDCNGTYAQLTIDFEAVQGTEHLQIEFPPDRRDLLDAAATILSRFVPRPDTRALRRVYQVSTNDEECTTERTSDAGASAAALSKLEEKFGESLGTGENVSATAFVPTRVGRSVAQFVGVTNRRVVIVEDRGRLQPTSHPLGNLTSVLLRRSMLGCWIEFVLSDNNAGARIRVSFDYPQSEEFVRVFSAVRQSLGQPYAVVTEPSADGSALPTKDG